MSDLRKAAEAALEALENAIAIRHGEGGTKYGPDIERPAIANLRAALAASAQPAPVRLTQDDIDQLWSEYGFGYGMARFRSIVRAVEAEVLRVNRMGLFTAAENGLIAGDGKPCPNNHDPDCRWPECVCRQRAVLLESQQ